MDPRITFSRASGATWFNSAGTLIGVDASSSSLTVGTGQQTLTLAATAGVDRGWIVGTSVLLSASTVTNTMTGVVVSYTASTQVLVVNVASVVGSGTYATWQVSNLMPRFDYNPSTLAAQGLLIEESRTNLLTYSEDQTNSNWSKIGATISANSTTAPDAQLTADTLVEDTSTGTHRSVGLATITNTTVYTVSAFAKQAGRTHFRLAAGSGLTGEVIANLSNGTVASSSGATNPSVQNVGNGWYRVSFTTAASTSTSGQLSVQLVQGTSTTSYTGDGTSGVYVWGAQLEAGAFPTSYIPTTTTALTRAADVASVNTLSPWYNASASTIYAEVAVPQLGRAARPWTVDDGSMANIVDTTISVANSFAVEAIAGGVYGGFAAATGLITANTTQKTAAVFTTSGNELACLNAGTVGSNAITLPSVSLTRLLLGRQDNGVALCGWLRRLTYYPRAFSAAELQAITT
jgi:hypothetical protein